MQTRSLLRTGIRHDITQPRDVAKIPRHAIRDKEVQRSVRRLDLRNWYIAAVTISTCLAIAAIVLGTVIALNIPAIPKFLHGRLSVMNLCQTCWVPDTTYLGRHYAFSSTGPASIMILLIVNVALTCLLDAHNRLNAIALLWLQGRCLKQRYNSNPRFFSGTKRFGPCHWSVNIVAALSMSVCYGATATMISKIEVAAVCDPGSGEIITEKFPGTHYGVDISGYPLAILGGSLLIQSLISIWTLIVALGYQENLVLSWSGDPMINALCMIRSSNEIDFQARTYFTPTTDTRSLRRSALEQVPRSKTMLWIMRSIAATLVVTVGLTVYYGADASAFAADEIEADIWQFWGLVYIIVPAGNAVTDWLGALIQSVMQGILASAMHCGDVLVGVQNDEVRWQEAHAAKRFIPATYRVQWRTSILFVAKSGIQFVFSFAISLDFVFTVALAPFAVVTTIFVLTVLLMEILVRRRPRGAAPTTYGEFKLLLTYISRYHQEWLRDDEADTGVENSDVE